MPEQKRTSSGGVGAPGALAGALIALLAVTSSLPSASAAEGDEAVLRSLDGKAPVDRKELARLLFGVAATLEGSKTSVRLLQSVAGGREPAKQATRDMFASRYHDYDRAVARFQDAASRLLDDPDRTARLYATLSSGQYACFRLDGFTRLAETYGATGADMLSVLSPIEGCELFRRAAFHPRVDELIERALEGGGDDAEVRALREELRAMEELLEDLRRIDAGE
jgi:hypothetical protein